MKIPDQLRPTMPSQRATIYRVDHPPTQEPVQPLPEHESQAFRNLGDQRHPVDIFSRCRVQITFEGIGLLAPEFLGSSIEIIDMLFGPLVFC